MIGRHCESRNSNTDDHDNTVGTLCHPDEHVRRLTSLIRHLPVLPAWVSCGYCLDVLHGTKHCSLQCHIHHSRHCPATQLAAMMAGCVSISHHSNSNFYM
jgi:hypothetical protein